MTKSICEFYVHTENTSVRTRTFRQRPVKEYSSEFRAPVPSITDSPQLEVWSTSNQDEMCDSKRKTVEEILLSDWFIQKSESKYGQKFKINYKHLIHSDATSKF